MIRVYLALAAFVVGVVAAAIGGHTYGTAQARAEFLALQNSDLRESRKEVERQIAHVTEAQKVYHAQLETIAASERRYRNTDRLRQQAERAARIATASAETCRAYATTVTDLFAECRETVIGLGHEAERSRAAVEALIAK